ncbi:MULTISPECIES: hypothetical protein [unclassified Micromonospora]|uniref:hypothetical protein n=1 Tax=unclassified Micromonospora TaxID=2617518 RepID=UPI0023493F4E|nr:hypothetical protein [Micromonospora sp. LH3U1]WCN81784.1 hypothetical protein PCA76_01375 [Micromonospora sp. LH3U1]
MDQIAAAHEALLPSVPLFDPTQLPLREWCAGSREDPLTGLIAFPDFHHYLPHRLVSTLARGGIVGLAIGDVDGLKQHVEAANTSDPASFGHLAGNRVMARLGLEARTWFHRLSWSEGCVATFGGDEVIIAAAIDAPQDFVLAITELRDRLAATLPVPVSFGLMMVGARHLPAGQSGETWPHPFTDTLLATVDRCLFAHKAMRRARSAGGAIVAITQPPEPDNARRPADLSTLPALPAAQGSPACAVARLTEVSGRAVLLLPYAGPQGLRGSLYRVAINGGKPTTQVVLSVHGQAALAASPDDDSNEVAVTLQVIHPSTPAQVPDDLAAALTAAGGTWHALPMHERGQLLHLIRESATPAVRAQRITAAVAAVTVRTRTSP